MSVREFQDAILARNLVARVADMDPVDGGESAPEGLSTGPTSLATPSELASSEPTVAKQATDFATPDALKKYLHDHPGADAKKHHVVKPDGQRSPGGLNVKDKIDPSVGKDLTEAFKGKKVPDVVQSVIKRLEDEKEVPRSLRDRAVSQLHQEATRPEANEDHRKKFRALRDRLKTACGDSCNPPLDPTVQEFADVVMSERIASSVKSSG